MKNLLILLVILVALIQCKKNESAVLQKTDYRDAFCGDFTFTTFTWWETISGTSHYDTTEYNSVITKLDKTDSLIFIRYKSGDNTHYCNNYSWGTNISTIVKPDGKLVYDTTFECSHTIFEGYFINKDTIKINITQISLGGIEGDTIFGVRIKK